MRRFSLTALSALGGALGALWSTPAAAVPLDGRYGLGYAQAIGGPAGLSLSLGQGNFIIETLVGFHLQSFEEKGRVSDRGVDAGVAAHFQLLRAQRATFTLGARLNLLAGRAQAASGQGTVQVLQWGADLPMRVYWFADEHIAIHTEFGLAFKFGPSDGVLTEGLTPLGFRLEGFGGSDLFGGLGISFWWG